jgi:CheY-like chemotaxis protein
VLASARQGAPRRVLVADDSTFMRRLLTQALRDAGFEVVGEAADGDEALDRFGDLTPDAVVLDLHMPGMSGTEVARQLRSADPSLVIVAYTADPQSSDKHELEALGVTIVAKTGRVETLLDALRALLASRP